MDFTTASIILICDQADLQLHSSCEVAPPASLHVRPVHSVHEDGPVPW